MNIKPLFVLCACVAAFLDAAATVKIPAILGNNMVLQQKQAVPIWGWDEPGRKVTVTFAGQEKTASADAYGNWRVLLSPLKASFEGRTLTISGSSTLTLTNVLVGEVWLGGGQSNMEYSMKGFGKPAVKGTDSISVHLTQEFPGIRIIKVERVLTGDDITTNGWNDCKGTALEKFSAPGFYFARQLSQRLKVPVGFILSAWSGSRIEPWTPYDAYIRIPAFADEVGKADGKISGVIPGNQYAHMIRPLGDFAIKGFLWYQGESNVSDTAMRYAYKMQALVEAWRRQWGNAKLPFYYVALAPYNYTRPNTKGSPENLGFFWEQQQEALKIPNTGMIVVSDLVDNLGDIHPSYKWEVGRRLSLLALANEYGVKGMETSGPVFKNMQVKGNTAILEFSHAASLKSLDGQPLSWFTVAGSDGKFVPAQAVINAGKVEVSAAEVSQPVDVRFSWNEKAQPNLVNGDGLPAVPFRTHPGVWDYNRKP